MAKIVISKSPPLRGQVEISGSKNSSLPILCATLLQDGICTLQGIPDLLDIENLLSILRQLGVKAQWTEKGLFSDASNIKGYSAPYELASKLRASFLIAGPLLARFGRAAIPLPGGCPIGSRPVDLHLKGFAALGARITRESGMVLCHADRLKGAKIYLDFPSVGATQNILMAASLAEGQTIIENAATEPEVVDLVTFLSQMGADIKGAGTDNIKINGKTHLKGVNHTIIPDRIEAGTFMIATAITGGKVRLNNVVPGHLKPISAKLREIGADVLEGDDYMVVDGDRPRAAKDIKTLPYPGFPTDMQAQLCTLLSVSTGTSMIIETIFENRFMHVQELNRMGASIKVDGRTAVIEGTNRLTGTTVKATDLRAGAALILAGLVAEGSTQIENITHIERGYSQLDVKLRQIGANISRID